MTAHTEQTVTKIWSNKNRIQAILHALQSSSDTPILILNQPNNWCPTKTFESISPSPRNELEVHDARKGVLFVQV